MTTSKGEERARAAGPVDADPETVAGALAAFLRKGLPPTVPAWPAVEYQSDPVGFARDILGCGLVAEQIEILKAIAGDIHDEERPIQRVAVRGGRKCGKDFVLSAAAIWFFCSFPDARVRFTAVTNDQVNVVFWREVKRMLAGHGRCIDCKLASRYGPRPCPHSRLIPEAEDVPKLARTGLKSADLREIVGYTAQEAEGAAGVSGGYQLNIVDEASGVDDFTIDAIEGNMGGCVVGRLAAISNPTQTRGRFYEIFTDPKRQEKWTTFALNSITISQKYGGRIQGLATRQWVRDELEQYGEKSDFATIHLRGDFPTTMAGTIFDVHSIEQAVKRWESAPCVDGPLYIGVDVAGESGTGDDSAFAVRIDKKILWLHAKSGLSPDDHLVQVLGLIPRFKLPNQPVVVIVDRGGEAGSKVYGTLIAYRQANWQGAPFELIGVDSSRPAQRDPKAYKRVRDELVANLADWVRGGGALPQDARLAAELHEFRWIEQRVFSQNQLVDKRVMRDRIGRSPDRADACALACWAERQWRPPTANEAGGPSEGPSGAPAMASATGDVYDDADAAMRFMREEMMRGPGRGR